MNNTSNPSHSIQYISMYDCWLKEFQPLLPIIADSSHLSINHLKNALPYFLKTVLLKLMHHPLFSQIQSSNTTQDNLLAALLLDSSMSADFKRQGINFRSLKSLSVKSQSIFEGFFEDETQKTLLAGILLEKTQMPLQKLMSAWQFITGLALASLSDVIVALQDDVTDTQIAKWLKMQPIFFIGSTDVSLINALNYQPSININEMQKQRQMWQNAKENSALMPYMQQIIGQMQSEGVTNFFTITSMQYPSNDTNHERLKVNKINKDKKCESKNPSAKQAVFVNHQLAEQANWIDKLQKNWIATATLLSVAVFGGVGAFISEKADQPGAELSVQTTQPLPKSPIYQDVAIIKVASVPSGVTKTEVETNKVPHSDQTKKTDITKSSQNQPSKKSDKSQLQNNQDNKKSSENARTNKDIKQKNSKNTKDENAKKSQANKAEKAATAEKKATGEKKDTKSDNSTKNSSSKKDSSKNANTAKSVKTSQDKNTNKQTTKKSTVN